MSRISEKLYGFSKKMFKQSGLGNGKLLIAFGVAIILSLLALVGFYVPSLITAINLIMSLAICGTTFMAISLLSGLNPAAMFAGLIVGIIAGAIAFALSSSFLTIAPAVALLLAVPNIIAAGAYVLGGICSVIERCCSFCFGGNRRSANYDYSSDDTFEDTRYHSQTTNYSRPKVKNTNEWTVSTDEFDASALAAWRAPTQQRVYLTSNRSGSIFQSLESSANQQTAMPRDASFTMNR